MKKIMKKIILLAALALGVTAAQAQVTVQGSKFLSLIHI